MRPQPRRAVTMADVAAVAGVSDRTVSNVLSGKVPVRPATRDAVLRAVDTLGYQMNVFARSLRTRETGFITLAIPGLRADYFMHLTSCILEQAQQVGWTVILQQTDSSRERELAILRGDDRQLSDGLIFHPHALEPSDRDALTTTQPMVLLGDRILGASVDHVAIDNQAAARMATQHLLREGRRRIAAIGPGHPHHAPAAAAQRLDGYRQALQGEDLRIDDRLLVPVGSWDWEDGSAAAQDLLMRAVPFDGLFCFNDTLAQGAMTALVRSGVRVPEDVGVVGLDNVPSSARTEPALTTVDSGVEQIAKTSVERLRDLVRGDAPPTPERVVVSHRLVRRLSS